MKVKNKAEHRFWKIIADIVLISFTTTSVVWASPSSSKLSPPSDLKSLTLPPELGRVDEVYLPDHLSPESPFIVYLQDAHSNLGAQKNIAQIIRSLGKPLAPNAIFVEGGSGEADLSELRSFPDQKAKERATEFWLKQAVLSGAEREAIVGPKEFRFFGIEEPSLYQADGTYFLETRSLAREFLETLTPRLTQNEEQRKKKFNKDLFRFEELTSKFESKNELIPLVSLIANEARNRHINRWKYLEIEKFIGLILLEMEGGNAERLLEIQKSLDPKKLFEEIGLLKSEIKEVLFISKEERALDREYQVLKVLRTMVSLKAKPVDFDYFLNHRDFIVKYARGMNNRQLSSPNVFIGDPLDSRLRGNDKAETKSVGQGINLRALESAEAFYRSARERDRAMFENLKRAIDEHGIKRAFLVTGGFHSSGMTAQLRKQGIPYVLVTPQISEEDNFENYVARIAGKRATIEDFELKHPELATSSAYAAETALLNAGERSVIRQSFGLLGGQIRSDGGVSTGRLRKGQESPAQLFHLRKALLAFQFSPLLAFAFSGINNHPDINTDAIKIQAAIRYTSGNLVKSSVVNTLDIRSVNTLRNVWLSALRRLVPNKDFISGNTITLGLSISQEINDKLSTNRGRAELRENKRTAYSVERTAPYAVHRTQNENHRAELRSDKPASPTRLASRMSRWYPPVRYIFYPLYKFLRRTLHMNQFLSIVATYVISDALHQMIIFGVSGSLVGLANYVAHGLIAVGLLRGYLKYIQNYFRQKSAQNLKQSSDIGKQSQSDAARLADNSRAELRNLKDSAKAGLVEVQRQSSRIDSKRSDARAELRSQQTKKIEAMISWLRDQAMAQIYRGRIQWPVVREVYEKGQIRLSQIQDKKVRKFMIFLRENGLNDIVLVGGPARNIFLATPSGDLDVIPIIRLTFEERQRLAADRTVIEERIASESERILRRLAEKLNADPNDLLNPDIKAVRFEGMPVHFIGPAEFHTPDGKKVLMRRLFADAEAFDVVSSGSMPTLFLIGFDASGKIYSRYALEDFLKRTITVQFPAKGHLQLLGALRTLALKHQTGFALEPVLNELIQEAVDLARNGNYSAKHSVLEHWIQKVVQTAKDPVRARKEMETLGIFEAVKKVRPFTEGVYLTRSEIRSENVFSENIFEAADQFNEIFIHTLFQPMVSTALFTIAAITIVATQIAWVIRTWYSAYSSFRHFWEEGNDSFLENVKMGLKVIWFPIWALALTLLVFAVLTFGMSIVMILVAAFHFTSADWIFVGLIAGIFTFASVLWVSGAFVFQVYKTIGEYRSHKNETMKKLKEKHPSIAREEDYENLFFPIENTYKHYKHHKKTPTPAQIYTYIEEIVRLGVPQSDLIQLQEILIKGGSILLTLDLAVFLLRKGLLKPAEAVQKTKEIFEFSTPFTTDVMNLLKASIEKAEIGMGNLTDAGKAIQTALSRIFIRSASGYRSSDFFDPPPPEELAAKKNVTETLLKRSMDENRKIDIQRLKLLAAIQSQIKQPDGLAAIDHLGQDLLQRFVPELDAIAKVAGGNTVQSVGVANELLRAGLIQSTRFQTAGIFFGKVLLKNISGDFDFIKNTIIERKTPAEFLLTEYQDKDWTAEDSRAYRLYISGGYSEGVVTLEQFQDAMARIKTLYQQIKSSQGGQAGILVEAMEKFSKAGSRRLKALETYVSIADIIMNAVAQVIPRMETYYETVYISNNYGQDSSEEKRTKDNDLYLSTTSKILADLREDFTRLTLSNLADSASIKGLLLQSEKKLRDSGVLILNSLKWVPVTDEDKAAFYFASGHQADIITLGDAAIPTLILFINNTDNSVRDFALQALGSIAIAKDSPLSDAHWKQIISKANSAAIAFLITQYPQTMNQNSEWLLPVYETINDIEQGSKKQVRSEMRIDSKKTYESIDRYLAAAVPNRNPEEIAKEYKEIHVLHKLVENDLPAVLDALTSLGKSSMKLVLAIWREATEIPPQDREKHLKAMYDPVQKYMAHYVPDKNPEKVSKESSEILSFFNIVHDNLGSVLSATIALSKPAKTFKPLRAVLPINNPLTRIIRLMGEQQSGQIEGYQDIVQKITQTGNFDLFFGIVVDIARKRQRNAPQEVAGFLEILKNTKELNQWSQDNWMNFQGQIQHYYENGFKVITFSLFDYFRKHENDAESLVKMREDISRELQNIAWGGFNGISEEFKKRYGLSTKDEVGLLAKYMPIANFSLDLYTPEYEKIKVALAKRGRNWNDEVDDKLRALFHTKGSRSMVVYDPKPQDKFDHEALHQRLAGYASEAIVEVPLALREHLATPTPENAEMLRQAIAAFVFSNSQLDRQFYKDIPGDAANLFKWITRWQSFFGDSFKHDADVPLRKAVHKAVSDLPAAKAYLVMQRYHLPALMELKDRTFREDKDMSAVIADDKLSPLEKQNELAEIFKKKWLVTIKKEGLSSENEYKKWIDVEIDDLSRRLRRKGGEKNKALSLSQEQIRNLARNALLQARKEMWNEIRDLMDEDRQRVKLESAVTKEILSIFSEDVAQIEKELRGFSVVEKETTEKFYVGFFDDLLHLMGFMMTTVCTWTERHEQVANTGFHFAKIALKNAQGRILGLSQVQLLKTDIEGTMRKASAKGWRVLALPGINLAGNIDMEQERAMLAILEAAQRLAADAGLEGAVIPVNSTIHSNGGMERQFIQTLVKRGWLKEVKLAETIRLSKSYSYDSVYLVAIPADAHVLQPASVEERKEREDKESERMEKEKALSFGDYLGDIIYEEPVTFQTAEMVKAQVDLILSRMPKSFIGNIRMNALSQNQVFRLRIDEAVAQSRVNKSSEEIELTLGRDILYAPGKVESIGLSEMVAEMLTAYFLADYNTLKDKVRLNENAYFKIENIKTLLLYRNYLERYYKVIHHLVWNPAKYLDEKDATERTRIIDGLRANLDAFTEGWQNLNQWNIFLNIMDDADPDFLFINYIHLLHRSGRLSEQQVIELIRKIAGLNISEHVSIAGLRNFTKEFILTGKARLKIGETVQEKERFDHFDQSQRLTEIKDVLLTTRSRNEFYAGVKNILYFMIPFGTSKELDEEVGRALEDDLFSQAQREPVLRKFFEEILIRKIGGNAYNAFKEHLTAQRGFKTIPYLQPGKGDLNEGDDADTYGFLQYVLGEGIENPDYNLIFHGHEGEGAGLSEEDRKDWVHNLFPFPTRAELRLTLVKSSTPPPLGIGAPRAELPNAGERSVIRQSFGLVAGKIRSGDGVSTGRLRKGQESPAQLFHLRKALLAFQISPLVAFAFSGINNHPDINTDAIKIQAAIRYTSGNLVKSSVVNTLDIRSVNTLRNVWLNALRRLVPNKDFISGNMITFGLLISQEINDKLSNNTRAELRQTDWFGTASALAPSAPKSELRQQKSPFKALDLSLVGFLDDYFDVHRNSGAYNTLSQTIFNLGVYKAGLEETDEIFESSDAFKGLDNELKRKMRKLGDDIITMANLWLGNRRPDQLTNAGDVVTTLLSELETIQDEEKGSIHWSFITELLHFYLPLLQEEDRSIVGLLQPLLDQPEPTGDEAANHVQAVLEAIGTSGRLSDLEKVRILLRARAFILANHPMPKTERSELRSELDESELPVESEEGGEAIFKAGQATPGSAEDEAEQWLENTRAKMEEEFGYWAALARVPKEWDTDRDLIASYNTDEDRERLFYKQWKFTPSQMKTLKRLGIEYVPAGILIERNALLRTLFETYFPDPYLYFNPILNPELLTLELREDLIMRLTTAAKKKDPEVFEDALRKELISREEKKIERFQKRSQPDFGDKRIKMFRFERTNFSGPYVYHRSEPFGYELWVNGDFEKTKPAQPLERIRFATEVNEARHFLLGPHLAEVPRVTLPRNLNLRGAHSARLTIYKERKHQDDQKNSAPEKDLTIEPSFWKDPSGDRRSFWLRFGFDPKRDSKFVTVHLSADGPPVGLAYWSDESKSFKQFFGPVFKVDQQNTTRRRIEALLSDPYAVDELEAPFQVMHVSHPNNRKFTITPGTKGFMIRSTHFQSGEWLQTRVFSMPKNAYFFTHLPEGEVDWKKRIETDALFYLDWHGKKRKLPTTEFFERLQSDWAHQIPGPIFMTVPPHGILRRNLEDRFQIALREPQISLGEREVKAFIVFEPDPSKNTSQKRFRIYGTHHQLDPEGRPVELLWDGYLDEASGLPVMLETFERQILKWRERHEIQLWAWGLGFSPRPSTSAATDDAVDLATTEDVETEEEWDMLQEEAALEKKAARPTRLRHAVPKGSQFFHIAMALRPQQYAALYENGFTFRSRKAVINDFFEDTWELFRRYEKSKDSVKPEYVETIRRIYETHAEGFLESIELEKSDLQDQVRDARELQNLRQKNQEEEILAEINRYLPIFLDKRIELSKKFEALSQYVAARSELRAESVVARQARQILVLGITSENLSTYGRALVMGKKPRIATEDKGKFSKALEISGFYPLEESEFQQAGAHLVMIAEAMSQIKEAVSQPGKFKRDRNELRAGEHKPEPVPGEFEQDFSVVNRNVDKLLEELLAEIDKLKFGRTVQLEPYELLYEKLEHLRTLVAGLHGLVHAEVQDQVVFVEYAEKGLLAIESAAAELFAKMSAEDQETFRSSRAEMRNLKDSTKPGLIEAQLSPRNEVKRAELQSDKPADARMALGMDPKELFEKHSKWVIEHQSGKLTDKGKRLLILESNAAKIASIQSIKYDTKLDAPVCDYVVNWKDEKGHQVFKGHIKVAQNYISFEIRKRFQRYGTLTDAGVEDIRIDDSGKFRFQVSKDAYGRLSSLFEKKNIPPMVKEYFEPTTGSAAAPARPAKRAEMRQNTEIRSQEIAVGGQTPSEIRQTGRAKLINGVSVGVVGSADQGKAGQPLSQARSQAPHNQTKSFPSPPSLDFQQQYNQSRNQKSVEINGVGATGGVFFDTSRKLINRVQERWPKTRWTVPAWLHSPFTKLWQQVNLNQRERAGREVFGGLRQGSQDQRFARLWRYLQLLRPGPSQIFLIFQAETEYIKHLLGDQIQSSFGLLNPVGRNQNSTSEFFFVNNLQNLTTKLPARQISFPEAFLGAMGAGHSFFYLLTRQFPLFDSSQNMVRIPKFHSRIPNSQHSGLFTKNQEKYVLNEINNRAELRNQSVNSESWIVNRGTVALGDTRPTNDELRNLRAELRQTDRFGAASALAPSAPKSELRQPSNEGNKDRGRPASQVPATEDGAVKERLDPSITPVIELPKNIHKIVAWNVKQAKVLIRRRMNQLVESGDLPESMKDFPGEKIQMLERGFFWVVMEVLDWPKDSRMAPQVYKYRLRNPKTGKPLLTPLPQVYGDKRSVAELSEVIHKKEAPAEAYPIALIPTDLTRGVGAAPDEVFVEQRRGKVAQDLLLEIMNGRSAREGETSPKGIELENLIWRAQLRVMDNLLRKGFLMEDLNLSNIVFLSLESGALDPNGRLADFDFIFEFRPDGTLAYDAKRDILDDERLMASLYHFIKFFVVHPSENEMRQRFVQIAHTQGFGLESVLGLLESDEWPRIAEVLSIYPFLSWERKEKPMLSAEDVKEAIRKLKEVVPDFFTQLRNEILFYPEHAQQDEWIREIAFPERISQVVDDADDEDEAGSIPLDREAARKLKEWLRATATTADLKRLNQASQDLLAAGALMDFVKPGAVTAPGESAQQPFYGIRQMALILSQTPGVKMRILTDLIQWREGNQPANSSWGAWAPANEDQIIEHYNRLVEALKLIDRSGFDAYPAAGAKEQTGSPAIPTSAKPASPKRGRPATKKAEPASPKAGRSARTKEHPPKEISTVPPAVHVAAAEERVPSGITAPFTAVEHPAQESKSPAKLFEAHRLWMKEKKTGRPDKKNSRVLILKGSLTSTGDTMGFKTIWYWKNEFDEWAVSYTSASAETDKIHLRIGKNFIYFEAREGSHEGSGNIQDAGVLNAPIDDSGKITFEVTRKVYELIKAKLAATDLSSNSKILTYFSPVGPVVRAELRNGPLRIADWGLEIEQSKIQNPKSKIERAELRARDLSKGALTLEVIQDAIRHLKLEEVLVAGGSPENGFAVSLLKEGKSSLDLERVKDRLKLSYPGFRFIIPHPTSSEDEPLLQIMPKLKTSFYRRAELRSDKPADARPAGRAELVRTVTQVAQKYGISILNANQAANRNLDALNDVFTTLPSDLISHLYGVLVIFVHTQPSSWDPDNHIIRLLLSDSQFHNSAFEEFFHAISEKMLTVEDWRALIDRNGFRFIGDNGVVVPTFQLTLPIILDSPAWHWEKRVTDFDDQEAWINIFNRWQAEEGDVPSPIVSRGNLTDGFFNHEQFRLVFGPEYLVGQPHQTFLEHAFSDPKEFFVLSALAAWRIEGIETLADHLDVGFVRETLLKENAEGGKSARAELRREQQLVINDQRLVGRNKRQTVSGYASSFDRSKSQRRPGLANRQLPLPEKEKLPRSFHSPSTRSDGLKVHASPYNITTDTADATLTANEILGANQKVISPPPNEISPNRNIDFANNSRFTAPSLGGPKANDKKSKSTSRTEVRNQNEGREILMKLLADHSVEEPLGKATQQIMASGQWDSVFRYLNNFSSVSQLIGPEKFVSLLLETRLTPETLEERAKALLSETDFAAFIKEARRNYQLPAKPLLAYALLASPEVEQGVKDFLKRENGRRILERKRIGQAFVYLLAARKTRQAALSFLSFLEPQQIVLGSLMAEESERWSAFWYYLTPLHQKLIEKGLSPEEASKLLVYLATHFDKTNQNYKNEIQRHLPLASDWFDWFREEIPLNHYLKMAEPVLSHLAEFLYTHRQEMLDAFARAELREEEIQLMKRLQDPNQVDEVAREFQELVRKAMESERDEALKQPLLNQADHILTMIENIYDSSDLDQDKNLAENLKDLMLNISEGLRHDITERSLQDKKDFSKLQKRVLGLLGRFQIPEELDRQFKRDRLPDRALEKLWRDMGLDEPKDEEPGDEGNVASRSELRGNVGNQVLEIVEVQNDQTLTVSNSEIHRPRNGQNRIIVSLDALQKDSGLQAEFLEVLKANAQNEAFEIGVLALEFPDGLQAESAVIKLFGPSADGSVFVQYKPLQLYARNRLGIAYEGASPQAVLGRLVDLKRQEIGAKGFSTRVIAIGEETLLSKLTRRDTPKLLAHPLALKAALLLFDLDGAIDLGRIADLRGLIDPTSSLIYSLQQAIAGQLLRSRAA